MNRKKSTVDRPWKLKLHRGLDEDRAWRSATNGRESWYNAGASHMNAAYTRRDFDRMGLVSLLDTMLKIHNLSRTAVRGK